MENKKTIIHLIQSLDNGGCENMLLRTLPLLSNFNHILVTLKKDGELAEKFKNKGFEIININQASLFNLVCYFRLIKIIKKINPDIVITYLFHADMIGRLFVQPFIKVSVIPFLRTTYNHEKYKFARLTEKLTKCFVKQYLANSESVKNFYVEGIGVAKEKITVIPNGIDVDFYDNIKRDENFRESLGIKKEDLAIICVANLHINKGHKYLLEAFEKLHSPLLSQGGGSRGGLKLLLVGDGDEKENLLKQSENYESKNNILFLGKRNDVPKLLKISDIFVLPTLFEGMSNAIMEAMACELPIITTGIPENQELIENNKTGILIAKENSNEIIKVIRKIISNENFKNQLGYNAKNVITNKFNLNSIIPYLTKLLKSA